MDSRSPMGANVTRLETLEDDHFVGRLAVGSGPSDRIY
jgi:hypothetical protein